MATLIHTHGIADIDYSAMIPADLDRINDEARKAGTWVVPGAFLAQEYVQTFGQVLEAYHERASELSNIIGFSIEGPLLGRAAGVPPRGIWSPSADQWRYLASLGSVGLQYIVMAPDGGELDDDLGGLTYREVFDLFYENGVRIALGHFRHEHPELSALRTRRVIDHIRSQYGSDQALILTDHLFNDMPRAFKHVWRTPDEQASRAEQLARVLEPDWEHADLRSLLGPVPAMLLESARAGEILPFLNFDGDHVDLEICKRTVDFLGAQNIIGITDDASVAVLAGEQLHHRDGNGLWYREDGMVAAGSGYIDRQLDNLRQLGLTEWQIHQIFATNPERGLQLFSAAEPLAA